MASSSLSVLGVAQPEKGQCPTLCSSGGRTGYAWCARMVPRHSEQQHSQCSSSVLPWVRYILLLLTLSQGNVNDSPVTGHACGVDSERASKPAPAAADWPGSLRVRSVNLGSVGHTEEGERNVWGRL